LKINYFRYDKAEEIGELALSITRSITHSLTHLNVLIKRVWRYQRVIRIIISKKDRQHNGQKKKGHQDKQRSTKLYHLTFATLDNTPTS